MVTRNEVIDYLRAVKDPEIPALDVVEMGIVRDVRLEGQNVEVDITPTYSGCPAMKAIENDIISELGKNGLSASVRTIFSPPWSTDWLTPEAKAKLEAFGIAPPGERSDEDFIPFALPARNVRCPYCSSSHTELRSRFSSTACKSMWFCNACSQPFEHFKPA
jgi:ring-1,2-phenylacetyl-CoA epoxidase subunit PaaD